MVFSLVGFIFWLSSGAVICADSSDWTLYDYKAKMNAVGSLAIINSCIYAAEGVLHLLNLRSGDEE